MESRESQGFVAFPDYRGKPSIAAPDVFDWRQWLALNHASARGCWLVMFKKESGHPSVYYPEAVDEALCWGWIDSGINKRDEVSFYQYFAPRHPKSLWSRVNKEKIERMQAEGRLQPSGLRTIALAKETGTWNALDDVENLVVPSELSEAFARWPGSEAHWQAFPRSVKRGQLEWIAAAVQPQTRSKRVEAVASKAAENRRAQFDR
ncbi:hypothetical protein GC167_06810 [bacterium]|nr:hypothetical protein [bacterium]